MRVLLMLFVLVACGGGGDKVTAPQNGVLVFKLDPVTCTGSGTVEPFIDGTSQGQFPMTPGSQQSFTVQAGSHTAGAREIPTGGYVWPTQNVTVPANGSWTTLLGC